jgi:hypothetical protein
LPFSTTYNHIVSRPLCLCNVSQPLSLLTVIYKTLLSSLPSFIEFLLLCDPAPCPAFQTDVSIEAKYLNLATASTTHVLSYHTLPPN